MQKSLIAILAVVVVLAGMGYAVIQNQTPAPEPTTEDSSQYSSADITFTYPDTYKLTERNDSFEGNAVKVITLIDKDVVIPDMSEGPPAISILIVSDSSSTTLEQWVKTKSISNFQLSQSQKLYPVTVGGEEALNYTHSGLYESEAYAVKHEGKIYLLSVGSIDQSEQITADFQKILKTVQLK